MTFKFTESEIRFLEENPDAYDLLKNYHDHQIVCADSMMDPGEWLDGCINHHESRKLQLEQERLRLEALI